MAENGLVRTALVEGTYFLALNNPERRNALSIDMMEAVRTALTEASESPSARVIVISGEGPVFCSGHDLKELTAARNTADRGRSFFEKTMRLCSSMMQQVVNHRLPVIASVQNTASAAGCQLVASCDLAVASLDARFITPGVNIGLFCSTPMVALSRNIANKHALEMLLTGEACSAERAAQTGLVNHAVPASEVDAKVRELTELIKSKSAMTLKTGKQAFYKQSEMPLDKAYEYCTQVMVENMLKNDAEEGINAFLEKREPEWRHE